MSHQLIKVTRFAGQGPDVPDIMAALEVAKQQATRELVDLLLPAGGIFAERSVGCGSVFAVTGQVIPLLSRSLLTEEETYGIEVRIFVTEMESSHPADFPKGCQDGK